MLRTFDKFRSAMPLIASSRGRARTAAILLLAAALLWPAIYSGFPIIFPDTSAYLRVALGHAWTLDRSGFYGLVLKPVSLVDPIAGLWIATAVQCLAIAAILTTVSLRLSRSFVVVTVMSVALCIFTSLPWHAAQLLPDAFTGPLILLGWMLASSDLEDNGVPLLWLGAGVLSLLHYTHLVIFPVAFLAALIVRAAEGRTFAAIARNSLALILCCSSVVAAHVAANGIMFNRWTVAPMGSYFLFARVHEDGLVTDWMDRHCGKDASPELCSLRSELPRSSQVLLWGGDRSPLNSRINLHPGAPETWPWIDRLSQAAEGSIREEPMRFVKNVLGAGTKQFISFHALDDECPSECQFRGLTRSEPALGAAIKSSRQVQGTLPKGPIRSVTNAVSFAALLLMIPTLISATWRRDWEIVSLWAAVVGGLYVNALLTGGLSDVHDRYQSRIVWLAPFVVLMAIARWSQRAGNGTESAIPAERSTESRELVEKAASLRRHVATARTAAASPSTQ
jgi:hypothetical protein